MERNQLLYVVETAKFGNITRAAEALHITQPSLSNQILNLERELGVNLFERSRKRVYLTEAGELFAENARQILNEMDDLKDLMSDYAQRRQGKIRIGALSTMLSLRIPELIAEFSRQNPLLNLTLTESGSSDLIKKINLSELDVAFVILSGHIPGDGLTAVKLMESQLMAVVNNQNPLASHTCLTMDSLRNQRLIITTQNYNLQRILLGTLDQLEIPYEISTVCNQIESCIALAEMNFGISFCSKETCSYFHYSNVTYIPVEGIPVRAIYLVYKKNPAYHPALQEFIRFVVNVYEQKCSASFLKEL